MSKFYVTTAIAYVNAAPHVGFALEVLQADALARYHRKVNDETYYLTGVDEHGVKIYEAAQERGMTTQDFVDENAAKFKALKDVLNLSNDDFVRTTNAGHKKAAQKLWQVLAERGDIYKDSYEGLYCSGCEAFLTKRDIDEEGNCVIHKRPPRVVKEENYFFRLSKYSDEIRRLIENDEVMVRPESRKKEMLNLIGEGLHDVSFSRAKEVLPWGIEVPEDESQVMYVWCDALTNYISALGYAEDAELYRKFWPCDVHVIGKDILRFHGGVWLGMLLSAGLPLPKNILVHGFITSEGQKMSKSLGNVVDPLEYVEKYGVDPLRYYLLREIPTDDDGDFSRQRFEEIYNSELANGLGNLLNRVVMMTERYLTGVVENVACEPEVSAVVELRQKAYDSAFGAFDIKAACEEAVQLIYFANKYTDDKKPWTMAKEGADLKPVLGSLLELVRVIGEMLTPIIPQTAAKIAEALGYENAGYKVKTGELLFPRLEG